MRGATPEAGALRPITVQQLAPRTRATVENAQRVNVGYVLMILPQVHLRKPCYDFYFL